VNLVLIDAVLMFITAPSNRDFALLNPDYACCHEEIGRLVSALNSHQSAISIVN
jgi:hypothetical protein